MTFTALQIAPLRPRLSVAPAGRARSVVAVHLRRRLLLLLAVAALLAASYVLVGPASTRTGAPAASPTTVLVGPGDTLWSIAARVAPGVDVRITVDRLIAVNGSSPIVVGQELELPA